MGDGTGIQWTEATWNPLRGCTRVSPGCVNCYAEKRAHRIYAQQLGMAEKAEREGRKVKLPLAYEGTTRVSKSGEPRWTGAIQLAPHLLDQPLRWNKPRLIFANSMSDLFHEAVPFHFIASVFGVMASAPRHTFQILTKRPKRALAFFRWLDKQDGGSRASALFCALQTMEPDMSGPMHSRWCGDPDGPWPLPNVWLGISAENQETYNERILDLIQCPAVIRWVSYEPALGPINFGLPGTLPGDLVGGAYTLMLQRLNWIVVGGESGAKDKVRPFHIEWARNTIRQGKRWDVPVFVKQMGTIPYQDENFEEMTPFVGEKTIGGEIKPGLCFDDKKGGTIEDWPEDLQVRQWPRDLDEAA